MRPPTFPVRARILLGGLGSSLLLVFPGLVSAKDSGASTAVYTEHSAIEDSTWTDHDGRPIPEPPERDVNLYRHQFRQVFVEPLSHMFDIPDKLLLIPKLFGAHIDREAVNVNAFDEVPNSTWFTNRNHFRAVPAADIERWPGPAVEPVKPWTIKHRKKGGTTFGFQIKDANGNKWLVKLDPLGYPQLGSGADMVSRMLLHAAGYNLPHNESVRFRRDDLKIDEDLLTGKEGETLTEADLDQLLEHGAKFSDGSHSGLASLFISGQVLGPPSTHGRRPEDLNDWYTHLNRRELRGLYVLCSWLKSWDMKDHNFLDVFVVDTPDSLGHVDHYVLDVSASLGAGAEGPTDPWYGHEYVLDWGGIGRRLITLGLLDEPWMRTKHDPEIPSVGNFDSEVYQPEKFKELQENPAFHEMTDRDGYWGAKIVASFSDAQIAAAIRAAGYEDPRASAYLLKTLIERRNKVARYWFDHVAPLDFFYFKDGVLRFHDLAVDLGLTGVREYQVTFEAPDGEKGAPREERLQKTELDLSRLAPGVSRLSLELSIPGSKAKRVRVDVSRKGPDWVVARVRHA